MAPRSKFKLALVGGETLRGREIRDVLERSDWKRFELEFYDTDVKEEYSAFRVWLVADNLTRSSALNAIEIARTLLEAKAR